MKKAFIAFVAALMLMSPVTGHVYAEDADQGNVITKMSDWAATVGKDKNERDRILAERKAARAQKHAEKKAEQAKKKAEKKAKEAKKEAKKAGKKMENAGKDMKEKLGM